jgi:hypothetical protein
MEERALIGLMKVAKGLIVVLNHTLADDVKRGFSSVKRCVWAVG